MAQLRTASLLAYFIILSVGCSLVRAESVAEARSALYAGYSDKLTDLAARCQKEGFAELAEKLRAWLPKREPATLYLFELPTLTSGQPDKPGQEESRALAA